MTTGNKIEDRTSGTTSNLSGSYTQKTWSGADSPKIQQGFWKKMTRTITEPALTRKGKRYVRKRKIRIRSPRPDRVKRKADNPYTMTYIRREYESASMPGLGYSRDQASILAYGSWAGSNFPMLTSNDQFRLIGKLRDKIQGTEFNLGNFLGEANQTLQLVGDIAVTLAKFGHHARRGDFHGAYATLKGRLGDRGVLPKWDKPTQRRWARDAFPERVLEFQYGIRPLLGDMKAAAEFTAHHLSVPLQTTYRTSIGGPTDGTGRGARVITQSNDFTSYAATRKVELLHYRRLIARISEHPSVLQQLNLTDPETWLWELTPYSMCVDWFIPIGQWLSARAFAKSLTGTFVTTDLQRSTTSPTTVRFKPPSGRSDTWIPQRVWKYVNMSRTVSKSLDVPMPRAKPLAQALSVEHCLNGLALALVAFRGNGRGSGLPKPGRDPGPAHDTGTPGSSPKFNWGLDYHP